MRQIWRACFGDDEAYLDFFLQNRFVPDDTPVLTLDDTVVSQLFLLPAHLRADDVFVPIDYLFAAATDPVFQGRGYMRLLLREAERLSRSRGKAAVVLLPGTDALYDYYAKSGYEPAFTRRELRCSREALQRMAVPAGEPADALPVLRSILRCRNGIVWDDDALRYALSEYSEFRGAYAAAAGAFACADGDAAAVIALPGDLSRGFDLLLRCSDAQSFALTLPPDAPFGELRRGGMIRFLRETFPIQQAFLSFAME